jgi:hypothetical protein
MDKNSGQATIHDISKQTGYPIFNPHMRKTLEHSVQEFTEKPSEAVDAIESAICRTVVASVRRHAAKWGEALGRKLTSSLDNVING